MTPPKGKVPKSGTQAYEQFSLFGQLGATDRIRSHLVRCNSPGSIAAPSSRIMNATDRAIGRRNNASSALRREAAKPSPYQQHSPQLDHHDTIPYMDSPRRATTPFSHPAPGSSTRSRNYNLAATLQRLDRRPTNSPTTRQELQRGRSQKPSRNSRPRELDSADPGDIFGRFRAR